MSNFTFCPNSNALMVAFAAQAFFVGCRHSTTLTAADSLDGAVCPYSIYWPPRDPEKSPPASTKPLLRGNVTVKTTKAADGASEVRLVMTVTRPSEESDREFWNSELAFADIDWMDEVRVWDADSKWLWPNLSYLLRLPGQERIERYGGIDPGKQVDMGPARDSPSVLALWRPAVGMFVGS